MSGEAGCNKPVEKAVGYLVVIGRGFCKLIKMAVLRTDLYKRTYKKIREKGVSEEQTEIELVETGIGSPPVIAGKLRPGRYVFGEKIPAPHGKNIS